MTHEKKLSGELARLELLVEPREVHALVDTPIVICLQDFAEKRKSDSSPDTIPSDDLFGITFSRPDIFVRSLGRTGPIGISYLTLYELLDPKKVSKTQRPAREDWEALRKFDFKQFALSSEEKDLMFKRIERFRSYNIRVVDVSTTAFRLALDMWFDARQGRISKHDPLLYDPIIAATAMDNGIPLYSPNTQDFEPFSSLYNLDFARVIQRQTQGSGTYLALDLAA